MENVLLLGIGGTGSGAVERFFERFSAEGGVEDCPVTAIVLDMDRSDLDQIQSATLVPLSQYRTVGSVCEALGHEALRDWFPVAKEGEAPLPFSAQDLHTGSGQWRKKGFLALNATLRDPVRKAAFLNVLDEWVKKGGPYRIAVVSSLAGGTGAGCLIPLVLYLKHYLYSAFGLSVPSVALLACPGIYTHPYSNRAGILRAHANAYATLRELHAIEAVTTQREGCENVHLRLGNDLLPTGLLFDSDRAEYRTPRLLPFGQVWLLDRLPSCETVREHEEVLASAIEPLLHGAPAIASRQSNLLPLRGRIDVLGGIGSARVEYPLGAILSYAVRATAAELVQAETSVGEPFSESPRLSARIEEYLDRLQTGAERILFGIGGCMSPTEELPLLLEKPPLLFSREVQSRNKKSLTDWLSRMLDAFSDSVRDPAARRKVLALADLAVSPAEEDGELSVHRLLREDGEILSVAAILNRISLLRAHLEKRLEALGKEDERAWEPEGDRSPEEWLIRGPEAKLPRRLSIGSRYARERKTDFPRCLLSLVGESEQYRRTRTNAYADALQCQSDVRASFDRLEGARRRYAVFTLFEELSSRLALWAEGCDQLLLHLRGLEGSLTDSAEAALLSAIRDGGNTLFAGASEEQKKHALWQIREEPRIRDSGRAFLAAEALRLAHRHREDPTVPLFSAPSFTEGLFGTLREAVLRSSAFRALRAKTILEVIADAEREKSPEAILGAFRRLLHRLKALAAPTLKVLRPEEDGDVHTLVLMSSETAEYLRRNALHLGLSPFSPAAAAQSLLTVCGMEHGEAILSESVSRHVLTVTSLRDGLSPALLADFSESAPASGLDSSYLCYREVLAHMEESGDGTGGMWNPHLGNDLHKPGHLPCLDPEHVPSDEEEAPT